MVTIVSLLKSVYIMLKNLTNRRGPHSLVEMVTSQSILDLPQFRSVVNEEKELNVCRNIHRNSIHEAVSEKSHSFLSYY